MTVKVGTQTAHDNYKPASGSQYLNSGMTWECLPLVIWLFTADCRSSNAEIVVLIGVRNRRLLQSEKVSNLCILVLSQHAISKSVGL